MLIDRECEVTQYSSGSQTNNQSAFFWGAEKGIFSMKLTAVLSGWFSICLLLPSLASSQVYTVTDLGTPGGTSSWAYGVNDFGHVVGYACVDVDCNPLHAFEWTRKHGIRDLGTFLGGG